MQKPSENSIKEKGSKFISLAYPVNNQENIKEIIKSLQKKYFDATHICYAYRLGINNVEMKAHDDGEPNHSAGTPILNVIRSFELTNCLIVVIRYYGGTKLGVSGLINAYKTAAKLCINKENIIETFEFTELNFETQYDDLQTIIHFIKSNNIEIVNQVFEEKNIRLKIKLKLTLLQETSDFLQTLYLTKIIL